MESVLRDIPNPSAGRRRARPIDLLGSLASSSSAARLLRVGWIAGVITLTVAAMVFGHAHRGPFPPLAFILAAAATAPLLVLGRWPLPVLVAILVADGTFVIWARLPWPPTAAVAWLLAMTACPVLLRRSHALVLLALTEAAVLAAVFVPASVNPRPWDAAITEASAVLLAWGGADALRSRRESERRRTLADEQMRVLHERAAIARGRAEVARELHDVVAHHVSLIAVRAATAPYQLGAVSDDTMAAFTEIAGEARAALDDLRTVLGVLRTADGHVAQAPQPRLADLPELVQRLRSTGVTVACAERGKPRPLGAAIELCCYRVIQEALTNAARHAPGSPVEVTIDYRDTEIAVVITNQGNAVAAIGPAPSSEGFGLVGMRERVGVLGGDFMTTDRENEFIVEAVIPLRTRRAS